MFSGLGFNSCLVYFYTIVRVNFLAAWSAVVLNWPFFRYMPCGTMIALARLGAVVLGPSIGCHGPPNIRDKP